MTSMKPVGPWATTRKKCRMGTSAKKVARLKKANVLGKRAKNAGAKKDAKKIKQGNDAKLSTVR